jgi:hypothetical protein
VRRESRCAYERAHELTPERAYDRRWALAVTERVMAQLEQEHALRGKRARFLRLRPFLIGDGAGYRPLAEELGEAEGTLRQRVDRMRRRYRLLLRAEIQRLVALSSDVDAELRHQSEASGIALGRHTAYLQSALSVARRGAGLKLDPASLHPPPRGRSPGGSRPAPGGVRRPRAWRRRILEARSSRGPSTTIPPRRRRPPGSTPAPPNGSIQ